MDGRETDFPNARSTSSWPSTVVTPCRTPNIALDEFARVVSPAARSLVNGSARPGDRPLAERLLSPLQTGSGGAPSFPWQHFFAWLDATRTSASSSAGPMPRSGISLSSASARSSRVPAPPLTDSRNSAHTHNTGNVEAKTMSGFFEELKTQRWDDHPFYHHSRINQALHLVSAISFTVAYVLVFTHRSRPCCWRGCRRRAARSATSFSNRKSYDTINQATHDHKEDISSATTAAQGRAMSVWAVSPWRVFRSDAVRHFRAAHRRLHIHAHTALMWLGIGLADWCSARVAPLLPSRGRAGPGSCG